MASTGTTFEDLSGISTSTFSNPYDALISACNNDPKEIEARYTLHRTTRNGQQKAKMLASDFPGVSIDPILLRLTDQSIEPGYVDPRNCLVFWARPPQHVKDIISKVQKELRAVAPNLWTMPIPNLHLTALEITHSRTAPEIDSLVSTFRPSIPAICDYPSTHPTRLIKPLISYDASALALSFVPTTPPPDSAKDGNYTYHHLRRDIYALCCEAGIQVDSRYVVPSSHLTIGRFVTAKDFEGADGKFDVKKMEAFIQKIEELNGWLEREFWPKDGQDGIEWIVGEEKGLVCRMGRLWYGDGETVYLGKGSKPGATE